MNAPDEFEKDPIAPARGIMVGCVVVLLLWAVIVGVAVCALLLVDNL